eukprot:TRINITY_DN12160_c0_g1_i1.p1 TRINITY_DN12160_c0_g1~~TRINITY_DN12160_c0_g1_i1.p1  ORF type:complete len:329 (-),score=40.29 TRINITY_DN12160_c0_g1_i1:98-982(-)
MAIAYGVASLGGVAVYAASLRVAGASRSPVPPAVMSSAYSMSAYLQYMFKFDWLPLTTGLLGQAAMALVAAVLVLLFFPEPVGAYAPRCSFDVIASSSGVKSKRYSAFVISFAFSAAALCAVTGMYDGLVASLAEEDSSSGFFAASRWAPLLRGIFPFSLNATLVTSPLLGYWVKTSGWIGPMLAQILSVQLLCCCLAWPSVGSLIFALLCSNLAQSAVYCFQGAYLTSFPQVEFSPLLAGTAFVQGLVQIASDLVPTSSSTDLAKLWVCLMFVGYLWPLIHWSSCGEDSETAS